MSKFVFRRHHKTRKRAKRVTGMPKLMKGVFPSTSMYRRLFSGGSMLLVQSSPLLPPSRADDDRDVEWVRKGIVKVRVPQITCS